jgi:outer membrane lipoprotein carrier protein
VSLFRLFLGLLAVSAFAADTTLDTVLKDVEARYNHTKTLQVLFTEQYTPKGGIQQTESGTLLLRKPLKMRWEYSQPKGKLVVSDGTFLYIYKPAEKPQKMKLKDSMAEEMQAPLAFLLGKLNFDREFKNLKTRYEGTDIRITGEPKNDNLPYSAVDFTVTPSTQIRKLKITLPDYSLEFTFTTEKMDPPLDAKLFTFQLPAGVQWDEAAH